MPAPVSPVRALPLGEPVLRPLSADGLARMHAASLRILDETGVAVGSAGIRDRLAAAGARVEGDRVRLPTALIEAALVAAPRTYTLAARDPAWDLPLDGAHGYLSVDGSTAEILDLETGLRRPSTEADLAEVTRLADALPEIAFLWQGVEAGDRPVPVRPLHELRTQLANSVKHVQLMTATTPLAARGAVEMARAVAGGADALRARPVLSSFQVSLSPLTFDGDALEAALVYAEAGVPAGFVVMAIGCATAPATPAGVLAQSNAEVLAGITMLETLAPGAPTFYGACSTTMDLRTGLTTCGGPEDLLYQAAFAQLARHYRVPSSIGTFAPGAKSADWQAGLENGLSGIASLLAGADMLSGAGLLYAARVFALEEMVLDAEIFGLVRHLAGGLAIDDATLAVDVIGAVGPGGNFLAEDHTVAHMRALWQPRLFDRGTWEEWEAAGRPSPRDRARERAGSLLASHAPPPLPDGVSGEIDAILAAFSREAGVG
ncbi:MAG TPA: trimethylamine methyltransferase family protein [Patescibacteria group bacterium]|nr:trimethylamine methyltransferase family protein [Patescibacteria group bacterium]